MKGLRTTLVSILAIGLLAGSAVGVVAQDEAADPMAASTFKWDFGGPPVQFIPPTVTDTDYGRSHRGQALVIPFEAGDPRASGLLTTAQNEEEFGNVLAVSAISRLVNDAGAWSGPWTGVLQLKKNREDEPYRRQVSMGVLTGEGAYEGLTLILTQTLDEDRGFIFPTDLLPPLPELPAEPSAE